MNKVNETTTASETTVAESSANTLVDRYIAIWNERDDARRSALIAQTWTADGSYLDPLMRGEGHAEIDAMIQAVQARFVGHRFHALEKVDAHNDHMRFSWELAPEGGATLIGGTDFATVAADGRLQSVVGFLDHLPATAG